MLSDHKTTNRYLALFTFVVSLIIYTITLAPTASFWDAGEFIAVAHGLQVNHPPGAPFYSIVGRLFSMFMPTEYIAVSINFISALSSALTVMFLYLIVVRLVREWKGHPDSMEIMDKIGMYGGALVGALTFAVTDTFWFSAVEAEVYAMSMFFTSIVVWMALKWAENFDKQYNERWLVLIAYMFGIAIGVHLLNLLALFFVALIVYFKLKEFEWKSFLLMGVGAVIAFFSVYPFTIQMIPTMANSVDEATYGLIGPMLFIFLFMAAVAYAIYYTHKHKMRIANIIAISYAMILIGFSSYSVIMIRSIADPPIDENDPETVEAFISYLKREQYGATPILKGNNFNDQTGQIDRSSEEFFPRRYSPAPNHLDYYGRYNSDWSYFWDYQVNHMYIRYFNWNFIGREADIQDTGWRSGFEEPAYPDNPASNAYFFIPFLLGLFGMIFHFSSDWKRALAILALFIVTGLAIIVFLNQPPYQPRERDYAYVGSFFAFSIWLGLGVTGIIELIKQYANNRILGYAAVVFCLLASPVWMGYQNWDDHDRSNRYVAPDYARNLLESVAPNAIIFTNGDNDTFPLWYAQEVEGIRTDVRIVCLSLLNTDWYIKQLRDQWSHESAPLPISLSDEEVERVTAGISQWQPQDITIPVDKEKLKNAFSEDMNYKEAIGVKPDTSLPILQKGVDFEMPVDSLDDEVTWALNGRFYGQNQQGDRIYYLQVQDRLILDILQTNNWLRPVYFANTVSGESQLNLQDYFRTEGKAYRVVPKDFGAGREGHINPKIFTDRVENFKFREWNNPDVYFDENIRRMLSNYRFNFMALAMTYREEGKIDSAQYWLKWGEEKIPFRASETNESLKLLYAVRYAQVDLHDDAVRLAGTAVDEIKEKLEKNLNRFSDIEAEFNELNQQLQSAQSRGDIRTQREIRPQLEQLNSDAQQYLTAVRTARQSLVLVQYTYYQGSNTEEANALAEEVNMLMGSSFPPMPATKEASEQEIQRYGIN
ncbi:protein O-mannosyl-transferase family [Gracilimonas sp. BCB1]|uniref:protein O-mannosyl-transferase family n=1 Tax=Gracilimonas sp. BCB1 TaxID=3152362 RepID=UPI0032D9296C